MSTSVEFSKLLRRINPKSHHIRELTTFKNSITQILPEVSPPIHSQFFNFLEPLDSFCRNYRGLKRGLSDHGKEAVPRVVSCLYICGQTCNKETISVPVDCFLLCEWEAPTL